MKQDADEAKEIYAVDKIPYFGSRKRFPETFIITEKNIKTIIMQVFSFNSIILCDIRENCQINPEIINGNNRSFESFLRLGIINLHTEKKNLSN